MTNVDNLSVKITLEGQEKYKADAERASAATRKLADDQAQLGTTTRRVASHDMQVAGVSAKELASKLSNLRGAALRLSGAIGAVAVVLRPIIKRAAEMDAAFKPVEERLSRTREEASKLRDSMRKLWGEHPGMTAEQVAGVISGYQSPQMTRRGYTPEQARALGGMTADAARIYKEDAKELSAKMATMIAKYEIPVAESTQAVLQIIDTAKKTGYAIGDIADRMNALDGISRRVGVSYSEMLNLVGRAAYAGLDPTAVIADIESYSQGKLDELFQQRFEQRIQTLRNANAWDRDVQSAWRDLFGKGANLDDPQTMEFLRYLKDPHRTARELRNLGLDFAEQQGYNLRDIYVGDQDIRGIWEKAIQDLLTEPAAEVLMTRSPEMRDAYARMRGTWDESGRELSTLDTSIEELAKQAKRATPWTERLGNAVAALLAPAGNWLQDNVMIDRYKDAAAPDQIAKLQSRIDRAQSKLDENRALRELEANSRWRDPLKKQNLARYDAMYQLYNAQIQQSQAEIDKLQNLTASVPRTNIGARGGNITQNITIQGNIESPYDAKHGAEILSRSLAGGGF